MKPTTMLTHLRLDQHKIDEQNDEIVLDIFIREPLASWALCQSHAFSKSLVIGFAVRRVQSLNGKATSAGC